jgi:hypothetical protein
MTSHQRVASLVASGKVSGRIVRQVPHGLVYMQLANTLRFCEHGDVQPRDSQLIKLRGRLQVQNDIKMDLTRNKTGGEGVDETDVPYDMDRQVTGCCGSGHDFPGSVQWGVTFLSIWGSASSSRNISLVQLPRSAAVACWSLSRSECDAVVARLYEMEPERSASTGQVIH